MRRWNGWGDESTNYPLHDATREFLSSQLGNPGKFLEIPLSEVIKSVPASRLTMESISVDPFDRLSHACGQSLPDWIALHHNQIPAFPDGIAYPTSVAEVQGVLAMAKTNSLVLIPYGGGTSVVGHINPIPGDRPVVTIDLRRMNRLIKLDEYNLTASIQSGASGPEIETSLNQHHYTLGHYPQSFEYSTLGGWIATRSKGQQAYYYGRIEDLFAGAHLETLQGPLDLPPFPSSAAGPDIRELILGSEGRLGIITEATVRIRKIPPVEKFYGFFFPSWQEGENAVREIAQSNIQVSMLRLSDADETETMLRLSGKDRLVSWANKGLGYMGFGPQRVMLVLGITGSDQAASHALRQAKAILKSWKAINTGTFIGRTWQKGRFLTPYLRNTLWDAGYAVDTLETAVSWSEVLTTSSGIKSALKKEMEKINQRLYVFSHLSHVYRDGGSVYVTFLFQRCQDPVELLQRWRVLKKTASEIIQSHGGTISHQHGIGIDHQIYLPREKGSVGINLIAGAIGQMDPQGIMNPGKLL